MNVLRAEEMSELEQALKENPRMSKKDYKHFKGYEVTYLQRAKHLPVDVFNYAIDYCYKKNLGKEELVGMLTETFGITAKQAENRLREVKKINKYALEQKEASRLRKVPQ